VKVIFLEDVPDVANAGETREVADGYGRNFLLPRKLAVLANSQASNIVEAQLKRIAHRRAQYEQEMSGLAGKLQGQEVIIKARAGAKDRLYGSITHADIAEELSKIIGVDIDKRKVELEEPIHQLGSYEVAVRLAKDIVPTIRLTVEGEEEKKEEEKIEEKKAEKKKKEKKKEKKEEKAEEEKIEEAESEEEKE